MPEAHEVFANATPSLDSPCDGGADVTPADSDLATFSRALYVGGTGDVSVITTGGSTITFSAVPAGTILPVRCRQVKSTGTTATFIDALW